MGRLRTKRPKRAAGQELQRWHWAYGGTCFRLDQRQRSEGGRSRILSRGTVMTRGGVEAFRDQPFAEAQRHGLAQADKVLVIADGALWIWNLTSDRFAQAHQRLDYHHASQHLWAVAHAPPAELASLLNWRRGEFSDHKSVTDIVAGSSFVCCVFGPRFPSPAIFCAKATRAVVAAMQETGVRRPLCVTGAMLGEYPANRSLAFRLFAALLARRFGEVFADRRSQEEIVRASGLD